MSDATEHFQSTLGNVPPSIAVLAENAPDMLDGYVGIRRWVLGSREGGLDLATKELIFVLLDVVYDNEAGALNHLAAAQRAGLTTTALLDAMVEVFMVGGIQTWGKVGHKVYEAALANERAHNSGAK